MNQVNKIMKANEFIEIPENKKPVLKRTNIRVDDIVFLYEDSGWTAEQIANELEITLSQVHQALAFYYDNVPEIRNEMKNDDKFVDKFRKKYEDKHLHH